MKKLIALSMIIICLVFIGLPVTNANAETNRAISSKLKAHM
ncbi:MAG: hypothetical protein WCD89_18745 [Anaerocolumna sp.]